MEFCPLTVSMPLKAKRRLKREVNIPLYNDISSDMEKTGLHEGAFQKTL